MGSFNWLNKSKVKVKVYLSPNHDKKVVDSADHKGSKKTVVDNWWDKKQGDKKKVGDTYMVRLLYE